MYYLAVDTKFSTSLIPKLVIRHDPSQFYPLPTLKIPFTDIYLNVTHPSSLLNFPNRYLPNIYMYILSPLPNSKSSPPQPPSLYYHNKA
jgi:hypothetical protein